MKKLTEYQIGKIKVIHIKHIIKLLKTNDQEKMLKASQRQRQIIRAQRI